MMSSSVGNAERCKDGKDPSLSSPNRYALRSKGPLHEPQKGSPLPQPQKRSGPRCKYPRHRLPPGKAPAYYYQYKPSYQDPENIPILGPRCKYPRHRLPPGKAPAHYYQDKPSYQDPENIPILEDPNQRELSEIFAEAALSYLSQQGHHFELLSLDYYEGGVVGGGARFHHNFQAKPAHDPDAPPETIFSQMFLRKDLKRAALKELTVECCVSLGPSHSLPKKRDNRGCVFCTKYIHHPKDGCEGMIC